MNDEDKQTKNAHVRCGHTNVKSSSQTHTENLTNEEIQRRIPPILFSFFSSFSSVAFYYRFLFPLREPWAMIQECSTIYDERIV